MPIPGLPILLKKHPPGYYHLLNLFQMRKICTLLLMSIIFSTAGMAQKKVVSKKNPNTPVFINTKSGKHIPVPMLKPVPASSGIQTRTPKKKVMMRNTGISKGNKFTKVTRRVPIRTQGKSNQRGGATFKDIDIYYPQSKIEVNYSSFQRKRR